MTVRPTDTMEPFYYDEVLHRKMENDTYEIYCLNDVKWSKHRKVINKENSEKWGEAYKVALKKYEPELKEYTEAYDKLSWFTKTFGHVLLKRPIRPELQTDEKLLLWGMGNDALTYKYAMECITREQKAFFDWQPVTSGPYYIKKEAEDAK